MTVAWLLAALLIVAYALLWVGGSATNVVLAEAFVLGSVIMWGVLHHVDRKRHRR